MRSPIDFRPFGATLRRLRRQKGLTQRDLAAQIGVSPAHLGRLERGLRDPRPRDLIALADLWNISTELLLAGCAEIH